MTKEVFICRCCGVCCKGEGGIFIRREDAGEPAELLGLSTEDFIEKYTEPRHGLLSFKTDEEGYCLMHDKAEHTCRIHEVKPQMCRDWPFFYGPVKHREGFEAARGNCPGILPETTWEEFVEYHKEHIGIIPPVTYIMKKAPEDQPD